MTRDHRRPWVIVGGGLAAAEAATSLRAEGYDGRLVVVSEERRPPYERPALSKGYLRAETSVEKLVAGDPAVWSSPGTELVLGRRAIRLGLRDRVVDLDDGARIGFDRLLLATGSRANRNLPGAGEGVVHVLRTLDDADGLRASAATASSAVVVGGGWIGAEVAASLRQMGLDVSLVIPGSDVLEQRLGASVARRYSDLHERNGVRLVRRSRVASVLPATAGPGVRLADGREVRGDLVLLGLGARPNVELAASAGLAVDGGVLAGASLETRARGVFVAGDVAAPWHPRYARHLRLEHWDTARRQGRVAAQNLLGRGVPYDRVPYFYSDQFDLGMETWGQTDGADVVMRELAESGGVVALWLDQDRVIGGLQANGWDVSKEVRSLVEDAARVDRSRLADPGVPLADVRLAIAA